MKKKIRVSTILKALDENGYPWVKSEFISPLGSCALGQVARNLGYTTPNVIGMVGYAINDALFNLQLENNENPFGRTVISYNDGEASSLEDVQKWAHEAFDRYADKYITIEDTL